MKNELYFVVPKLIEQPTWGGEYILQSKNWSDKSEFAGLKIGQSYELFSGTKLRGDISSSEDPSFTGELGYSMEPDIFHYSGDQDKLIALKDLIDEDAVGILGKTTVERHGKEMKILNKYTQAKGNSFQLHVRESDSGKKWHFKPESWYYFEPGLLTLGVKADANWIAYEAACRSIDEELRLISADIKNEQLSLIAGREKAKEVVKKYNPWQYVNVVEAKRDDLIDLSCGGLHHSWEDDPERFPLGNIVYELCYDVMDPISSVRSFDKGKIKDDGSLRKVDVADYFSAIDRSPEINRPSSHIVRQKVIFQDDSVKIEDMLRTKYYCLDKMTIGTGYSGEYTETGGSFHHLFVKTGKVRIKTANQEIILTGGHACLIPAFVGRYGIETINCMSEVLKTFVN